MACVVYTKGSRTFGTLACFIRGATVLAEGRFTIVP